MAAKAQGSVALVTGGNRGIGRAFVDQLIARGASKVYVGSREPVDDLPDGAELVLLDVTDRASIAAAAAACTDVTVLINNAGLHARARLVLTDDPDAARREMDVNYFGVLEMIRAFAPILGANGGGAIVNVSSIAGAVPTAFMGGYSPSKAAGLFLSSIARAELEPQGTTVTALVVGSVDTRMSDHVIGAKEDAATIAKVGLSAMGRGERVVDTDQMAVAARASYALDPVRFERALAKMLDADLDTGR
ncbi:MAG: short-chain dehydrogenase [Ilumatobacteraceae bacterium]|nr:short-chain dehydrogenase [Ilumatobacteraceae bacterium]